MRLPMFPLGTVLFPYGYLPLHVFEPRYRDLTRHCLDAGGEFGVVLIERGSEVGGGDVRSGRGTVARIVEAVELPDGRWVLGAVGTRRFEVRRWLPDDPYPVAEVEARPEPPPGPGAAERRDVVARLLRRALALKAELGEWSATAEVALHEDPAVAAWQAAGLSPIGPADAQRLLSADGADEVLSELTALLEDEITVLGFRLSG